MIRQIAPQFFTTDLPATFAYYRNALGFEGVLTWDDPPVYAIVPGSVAQGNSLSRSSNPPSCDLERARPISVCPLRPEEYQPLAGSATASTAAAPRTKSRAAMKPQSLRRVTATAVAGPETED
jgi:catechol 2,3-dioxygenase-like lactoylglutathione lyase family enzyme